MRLPTFTDLYYAGPANIGNPDLLPEEALNFDFGVSYNFGVISLDITSFNNFGTNNIAWVKENPSDEKWQPKNLTSVQTYGVDTGINFALGSLNDNNFFIENLSLQYTYIHKEFDSKAFEANYINDYLKQKLVLGIQHRIYGDFSANWKLRYQDRSGNYMLYDADTSRDILTPYDDYVLMDIRIMWHKDSWNVFADVKNIFDVQYIDYGNVLQPGRWFSVGIKKEFGF